MDIFPIEIIELILSKINTLSDILICRKVNRHWYYIFKNIKLKDVEFTLSDNYFNEIKDGKRVREIYFYKYGRYKYLEYINNRIVRTIKNDELLKINTYDIREYLTQKYIEYDLKKDEKNERLVHLPFHPCTIS